MSHDVVIANARRAVEEALRQVVRAPTTDGRALACDAALIHHLAGALTRLERARQALVEYET